MTCEISFLPVGNADCIVVNSDNAVIVVDLGKTYIPQVAVQR